MLKQSILPLVLFITLFCGTALSQDGMLAEVRLFAGNFAPRGWGICDGKLLEISNNQALFSLLGTTYGGDGRTTFALPDLRGRVPVGTGTGPGLPPSTLGQKRASSTAGSDAGPTLGLNYIICMRGVFPSRQ